MHPPAPRSIGTVGVRAVLASLTILGALVLGACAPSPGPSAAEPRSSLPGGSSETTPPDSSSPDALTNAEATVVIEGHTLEYTSDPAKAPRA